MTTTKDVTPTPEDVKAVREFLIRAGSVCCVEHEEEALAYEFARVRAAERERCAKWLEGRSDGHVKTAEHLEALQAHGEPSPLRVRELAREARRCADAIRSLA